MKELRDLITITANIGGQTVAIDIEEQLQIGSRVEEINAAVIKQAYRHAWISVAHELAKYQLKGAKRELDRIQARISQDVTNQFENMVPPRKWTVGMVADAVAQRPEFIEAAELYDNAEKDVNLLAALRDASWQAKDMLVTASANMRREEGADLPITTNRDMQERLQELKNGVIDRARERTPKTGN